MKITEAVGIVPAGKKEELTILEKVFSRENKKIKHKE